MSHREYHRWLLKLGTGWLGWTEEQTLATRMSSIGAAYEGRLDMLKAIFGSGDKPAGPKLISMKDSAAVGAMFRKAASAS